MTDLNFQALAQQLRDGADLNIEVHGIDPMIYVAYVAEADHLTPIVNSQGNARFPSQGAVQQALREAGVKTVTFVHRSAYGEMVGLEDSAASNEMRQVITLRSDAT